MHDALRSCLPRVARAVVYHNTQTPDGDQPVLSACGQEERLRPACGQGSSPGSWRPKLRGLQLPFQVVFLKDIKAGVTTTWDHPGGWSNRPQLHTQRCPWGAHAPRGLQVFSVRGPHRLWGAGCSGQLCPEAPASSSPSQTPCQKSPCWHHCPHLGKDLGAMTGTG